MKDRSIKGARRIVAVVSAVVGLSVLAACSSTPSASGPKIRPGKTGLTLFNYQTNYGQAVGTIAGIVAYSDSAEHAGHFECTSSACTDTWHPWLTYGATVKASPGVQQSLIGHVKRPDGTQQMSYGGHPLYLYAHNKNAIRANAEGAGGVWYVVGTDGNIIK